MPFAVDSVKLRNAFPLLVPIDPLGLSYDGFISVFGHDYRLKVKLKGHGSLRDAQIEGDMEITRILENESQILQKRLKESTDLTSFLLELSAIIETRVKNVPSTNISMKSPIFYSKLQNDLVAIGWERVKFINEELNDIHIKIVDFCNREHLLLIKLSTEYPVCAPKVQYDLPREFHFLWKEGDGLIDVLNQFEKELDLYKEFWDELDDVSCNSWVLEPQTPRRSDVTRRIALGEGASLIFTIENPLSPRKPPSWQMFGNEKIIEPLQRTLEKSFGEWNERNSIMHNWKNLLTIELPSPHNTKREDIQKDCGICYSYMLEDKVPDKICEDTRCRKEYHYICLFEWLKALPTSRRTFNLIFGECPYCNAPISC